jgi:hypothetical protein
MEQPSIGDAYAHELNVEPIPILHLPADQPDGIRPAAQRTGNDLIPEVDDGREAEAEPSDVVLRPADALCLHIPSTVSSWRYRLIRGRPRTPSEHVSAAAKAREASLCVTWTSRHSLEALRRGGKA